MTLTDMRPAGPTFCGRIEDRIAGASGPASVRDVVCWGDGWMSVREPDAVPVLAPAFAEPERVYVVRSGGTLAAVARRTRSDPAALAALNPAHPARLPAGTRILLP